MSTSAAEGEDVLLRVHKKPFNFIGFKWYRGKGANPSNKIASYSINQRYFAKGLAHSSREEIHYDGSLLLRKVTKDDTGLYTVEVYIRGFKKETAFGWLEVHGEWLLSDLWVSSGMNSTSHMGLTAQGSSSTFLCIMSQIVFW